MSKPLRLWTIANGIKVVWSVLNALRAHDDRFNATINKIDLNKKRPDQILVGRPDTGSDGDSESTESNEKIRQQLAFQFEELQTHFLPLRSIAARDHLRVGKPDSFNYSVINTVMWFSLRQTSFAHKKTAASTRPATVFKFIKDVFSLQI
jgi:hypothetical protein